MTLSYLQKQYVNIAFVMLIRKFMKNHWTVLSNLHQDTGWSLLPVIRIIGHYFDPRLTQTVRALAIFCYERLGELARERDGVLSNHDSAYLHIFGRVGAMDPLD